MEAFKTWMKGLPSDYDGGNPDPVLETFYRRLLDRAANETRCRMRVHRGRSVEITTTFLTRISMWPTSMPITITTPFLLTCSPTCPR